MFLDALGFSPQDPPKAALVTQTTQGEQDILVIELLNPVYDAAAGTLTYDARLLADYGKRGLDYLAQQQTDYELAAAFGQGSLFIDDCPNSTDYCYTYSSGPGNCTSSSQALTYVAPSLLAIVLSGMAAGMPSLRRLQRFVDPSACQRNCFDDIAMIVERAGTRSLDQLALRREKQAEDHQLTLNFAVVMMQREDA